MKALIALMLSITCNPHTADCEQKLRPVSVFVGPQIRDGFVDTDAGTQDSIKDVKSEFYYETKIVLANQESAADVVLYIVRRESIDQGDSVGVASGGVVAMSKVEGRAIRATLKVGKYERSLVGTGGTWSGAAGGLVKDLKVWIEQNRDRLPQ